MEGLNAAGVIGGIVTLLGAVVIAIREVSKTRSTRKEKDAKIARDDRRSEVDEVKMLLEEYKEEHRACRKELRVTRKELDKEKERRQYLEAVMRAHGWQLSPEDEHELPDNPVNNPSNEEQGDNVS
jgi:FtsZ-interacting cell division protein ZipA